MEGQNDDNQGTVEFIVKGKPKIDLATNKGINTNLKVMLEQKIEEIRQREKLTKKQVIAHPGSEFKPENMPYFPDSNNPLLSKHDNATIERNAGFQDRSQVPKEYLHNVKKEGKSEVILESFKADPIMDIIGQGEIESPVEAEAIKPETKVEAKQPEFTMKVSRENMNKGGFYMPNEYRPYKPGG